MIIVSELFATGLPTYDMGFTPALSSVLVASGDPWRVAGDANVSAVTASAALWIRGFQAVPTRQTLGTLATSHSNLTPTLPSHLKDETQVKRIRGKERKKQTSNLNKLYVCILCSVYLCTCLASIDSSSSVTVALPTHIQGRGIRVFQPEKATSAQLTVLP